VNTSAARLFREAPVGGGESETALYLFAYRSQPTRPEAMSSIIHSQVVDIPHNMTTTTFELPGFRVVANMGVVRGVVVRSRSVVGTIGAGIQTIFGGNISLFTELAERTRQQAFDTMLQQAHLAGADAVIGVRYDANEIMKGVTEVLCYGTAVQVEASGH
jgi:uncharacterized protein YbjQ (UPF0145 family)